LSTKQGFLNDRPDSVRLGLPRQTLMIEFLAAAIIIGLALPTWAENPPSGDGSLVGLPTMSHADQNMSSDGQQPPPGAIVVSQIHNAPGWQPSHSYTYATSLPYTRVVSGAGWSPANGSYNPGQTLGAYQLISSGACASASSGGPSGTGSSIKDGTCTWKYLSNVDYISTTGWAFDNRPWKSGTLYNYRDYVTSGSPLRAYALEGNSCTSIVAPAGTGSSTRSMVVTSDGCQWQYQVDIIYTSAKSFIPTETSTGINSPTTIMLHATYEGQLWNDREYVAGRDGEAAPIRTQDHNDFRHEGGVLLGCPSPCYHIIITAAQGESFRDSLTPSEPLTGYDPNKGVAIRNSLPYQWPYEPAGFDVHDNGVDLIGLQIKSVHGAAVNGMLSFGNVMTIRDCILDGGSDDPWTAHAAVTTDTNSVIANSLVISHAPYGIVLKYPGFVLHSTIVNPDHTAHSIGIETYNKWVFDDTTVSSTAIFGFTHTAGHYEVGTSWSPRSSNNMTDTAAGDSGTEPWPYNPSIPSTVDRLPGTIYGVSMASAFVKPGGDWRLPSTSPLRGAGSAFGTFGINCEAQHPSCPQRTTYNFDTPNIIGTARPQAGRYDIGAW
jgi:hypothetical protein